jgi:peptidoglycan/LPS O-acetylase OafA/YrhL
MLALMVVGFYRSVRLDAQLIVNSLFLLPFDKRHLMAVAWTLVFEIYFYLVFAISLPLRSATKCFLCTSSMLAISNLVAPAIPHESLRAFLSSQIVFEFCFGLAIGLFVVSDRARVTSPGLLALLGAVSLLLATSRLEASSNHELEGWLRVWAWGLPAALIVLSAVFWSPRLSVLSRVAVLLGDASYAIYLTHAFVMAVYAKALRLFPAPSSISQWPVMFAVLTVALACGVIAHLTVERFAIRLTRPIVDPRLDDSGRSAPTSV